MDWVSSILTWLFVIVALLMTFLILLQEGKGGGLTALGGTKAAGVEGVTNPIRRATGYLAGIFFILAMTIGVLHRPDKAKFVGESETETADAAASLKTDAPPPPTAPKIEVKPPTTPTPVEVKPADAKPGDVNPAAVPPPTPVGDAKPVEAAPAPVDAVKPVAPADAAKPEAAKPEPAKVNDPTPPIDRKPEAPVAPTDTPRNASEATGGNK
jgi:protein translocase SecG subunit